MVSKMRLTGSVFHAVWLLLLAIEQATEAFCFSTQSSPLTGSPIITSRNHNHLLLLSAESSDSSIGKTKRLGTFLCSSSLSNDDPVGENQVDISAIAKYGAAIMLQTSLIGGVFYGLDLVVDHFSLSVPFTLNIPLFYAMALKSRIFNPLSNERPKPQTLEAGENEAELLPRKMPSWTPPGVVFPIMWLLIIGPIRAVSSAMIYAATGHYACLPLLALVLNLSVGDVWNTINNVERRYGTAVTGVLCVWLSNAHAAYQYYLTDPLAGKLLGGVSIWLTIAASLVAATWRINPDPQSGMPEPLYPVKGKATTKFTWFE